MKRIPTIVWLTLIGVLAALTIAASTPVQANVQSATKGSQVVPTTPVACDTVTGHVVTSPNNAVPPITSSLNGVTIIAANDVWAVGTFRNGSGVDRTLIEHWDGVQWTMSSSPNLGTATAGNYLLEVSGSATNDVWAVGWAVGIGAISLHWDGTQWTSATVPNLGSVSSNLQGVKDLAPNNVWAVGSFGHAGREQTVAIRWDGTQWLVIPSPVLGYMSAFYDIDAVSANDMWAVGKYRLTDTSPEQTLTAHYDGTVWTVVTSPNAGSNEPNFLFGVTMVSANDVWAVGSHNIDVPQTLVLHYNGSAWTTVNSTGNGTLAEVVAISANDVLAVGSNYDQNTGAITPLTGHWNGSSWTTDSAPSISANNSYLYSVAKGASGDVWAVGKGRANLSNIDQSYTAHRVAQQWNVVPDQTSGSMMNNLMGVDAVSSTDIWAVGYTGSTAHTLIEHWDGTTWTIVPSPNAEPPSSVTTYLMSVSASSSGNAWAVGYSKAGTAAEQTIVMHWDGSTWSIVASPNVGTGGNFLYGVKAVAANDAWAVGYSGNNQPLAMHWNGSAWSVSSTPTVGTNARLMGVEVVSATDVVAVGSYASGANAAQTLVLRWNGSTWTQAITPDLGSAGAQLNAVSAVASNDIWAVGYHGPSTGSTSQVLAMHWNGSAWSEVSTGFTQAGSRLYDVKAVAANSVWVVGNGYTGVENTLVMRWNGTNFSVIGSPETNSENYVLYGVTAAATNDIWAVGQFSQSNATLTLAEQYGPATFTDVPSDNTFFPYVQCMVCRGIVNGYSDGSFRPNNNVTRGQLAKIVSNSAGFNEDPGPQRFEDITPDSTFYSWVNRLAARGDISGYTCGGPGEPCGADNLPYFRPNANATRGQISKIVSNAAGFNEVPTTQTFEDVPASNPFYLWVERLGSRGIMGGYACGGPGEPCGSGNLPYFRQSNNATRGQTSKIVANAFFPNCTTR